MIKCPLCGLTYDPQQCHSSCPMSGNCKVACCPNCGYQVVTESSLVNLWRKITRRGERIERTMDR